MAKTKAADRLVIGLDFGTTYSGVAEAYSASLPKADDINVIKTWPGGNNATSDKVPSEIAYRNPTKLGKRKREEEQDDWGLFFHDSRQAAKVHSASYDCSKKPSANPIIQWGFQLPPEEPKLRCMKLFLDGRQELPDFVSRSEICDQLSNSGKDAVSVVTDYLHEIYEHTKKQLVGRYGATFVEDTEIQWVLTVPAIWSDAAKDATLAAARRAKIGPALSLISEPEAAAIYTLQAMQPKQLKVGNNYVVCDAGGGTVDLISYEIKSKDPLRVEESVEGSGACCGGAVLNAEFEKLIRSKMGDYAFSELCKNRPKAWTSAMNFFESYVKRVYDPSSPKSFNIPFPGVANDDDADIDEGFMRLSSREVGNMFKPILLDILNLVKGQIDSLRLKGKLISGVILVGGFGKSTCLKEFLKYSLEGKSDGTGRAVSNTRFEILQPAHAWSAVARGAVLRGIEDEDLVLSRKSRRHYGIARRTHYDDAIHPLSCREWEPLEGVWKARGRMKWYIKKGETVSSTTPILFSFYRTFTKRERRVSTHELVVCDSNNAPDGYDSTPGSPTRILCKLVIDLEKIPKRSWKKLESPSGRPYDRIDYELGMQVESGRIRFDLRVNGVAYGDVTASFDSD